MSYPTFVNDWPLREWLAEPQHYQLVCLVDTDHAVMSVHDNEGDSIWCFDCDFTLELPAGTCLTGQQTLSIV